MQYHLRGNKHIAQFEYSSKNEKKDSYSKYKEFLKSFNFKHFILDRQLSLMSQSKCTISIFMIFFLFHNNIWLRLPLKFLLQNRIFLVWRKLNYDKLSHIDTYTLLCGGKLHRY